MGSQSAEEYDEFLVHYTRSHLIFELQQGLLGIDLPGYTFGRPVFAGPSND